MCEEFDGQLPSADDFRRLTNSPFWAAERPVRRKKPKDYGRPLVHFVRRAQVVNVASHRWPGHIPNIKQGRAVVLALLVATRRAHAAKKAKRDEAGWDHAEVGGAAH